MDSLFYRVTNHRVFQIGFVILAGILIFVFLYYNS